MVNLKKQIAIALRAIEKKEKPRVDLEQYELDSEVASNFIYNVLLHYRGEEILDAGCGSGSLSLASILAGFNRVIGVDIDFEAVKKLKENSKKLNLFWALDLIVADFLRFSSNRTLGAIIMNPPFGTKRRHYDRDFLIKAFDLSYKVFSLHKKGDDSFFLRLAEDFSFTVKKLAEFRILLKPMMPFHRKPKYYVDVIQYYFSRDE